MKIISKGLTQKIGRQILVMKKNSPQSLFILGVAGVIGGTFLACRATIKLDKTLDDFKKDVDAVETLREKALETTREVKSYNRQMAFAYVKGSYNITKLYAPAILIGTVSIAALTNSHVTLMRRNTSLTAAYSALSASFDSYRERVKKEVGEERELELHHAVEIERRSIAGGDLESLRVADPNKWSPYAKFFDEYNTNWQKNPEYNRIFIQCQQNHANNLLQARGHVFLNEVYDMLGIERSKAGQVVGWVLNQGGDNYVDFGMFEASNSQFVNGWERSVILDFNVDGVIYNKI